MWDNLQHSCNSAHEAKLLKNFFDCTWSVGPPQLFTSFVLLQSHKGGAFHTSCATQKLLLSRLSMANGTVTNCKQLLCGELPHFDLGLACTHVVQGKVQSKVSGSCNSESCNLRTVQGRTSWRKQKISTTALLPEGAHVGHLLPAIPLISRHHLATLRQTQLSATKQTQT